MVIIITISLPDRVAIIYILNCEMYVLREETTTRLQQDHILKSILINRKKYSLGKIHDM